MSSLSLALAGVSAFLLFAVLPVRAEDSLRELQSALKTKGYFYGEVTGKSDQETRDALRRCQIHEGLPVTGELDKATAQALSLVTTRLPNAASPAPAAGAAAPPLGGKRKGVMPPAEIDREYLRQLENGAPTPAPRATPAPAPRATPPPTPRVTPAPAASRATAAPTPRPAPLYPTFSASPLPPPPAPRTLPPIGNSVGGPLAEIDAFVRDYVAVGAGADVYAEMALYADLVNYFDSGRVSRRVVLRDVESYRRQWPERSYLLEGKPLILDYTGPTARVRIRLSFRVQNNKSAVEGRVESTLDLRRRANGRFEIIAVQENRLPSR